METKLLNLNAYGVEEMSVAEMHETDGGFLKLAALVLAGGFLKYVAWDIIMNPTAAGEAWAAGRERAQAAN